MISISSEQYLLWISSFIWPLTRILGLIALTPILGNPAIPVRIKISFGVVLALIVAPTLSDLPRIDPVSLPGMMILLQQFIIGVAMGLTMQLVFNSIDFAGNLIGMSTGLGFASFYDPQTHGHSSAISQLLTLIATLLFLSLNLHLTLLETLVNSFHTLPIGSDINQEASIGFKLVTSASIIFSAGVQLSLPIVAALLVTNIALGILTKAAPQLNLFGIGFPITIAVGFLMLFITLPYLAAPLQQLFEQGIQRMALR
jgi:flagellar biosynthetic protein FliR